MRYRSNKHGRNFVLMTYKNFPRDCIIPFSFHGNTLESVFSNSPVIHPDLKMLMSCRFKESRQSSSSFVLTQWVLRCPTQAGSRGTTRYCEVPPMSQSAQQKVHYIDVIMTMMASQITSLTVVYSIVYSGADQRKHQSSASLAFVWGIHRDRWIPRTKRPVTRKMFPFDDVIIYKKSWITGDIWKQICIFYIQKNVSCDLGVKGFASPWYKMHVQIQIPNSLLSLITHWWHSNRSINKIKSTQYQSR